MMKTELLRSAIEDELQKQVARLDLTPLHNFHEMLAYHMGWSGEGAGPNAQGKRIRPIFVLLSTAACNSQWLRAVPAAAAVELVHNFSLVHDDIQDASEKRRGRSTVWAKWGAPMAINVGDALFVMANLSMLDLAKDYPVDIVLRAAQILNLACLELTRGQYLDMAGEGRTDLTLEDYWPMIRGKTAALLASSCHLGALLGGADEGRQETFRSFGECLGLAFQVQDDILGIWGDEKATGKSSASDLIEGKNSLPVLYGLSKNGRFAALWKKGHILPPDVKDAAGLLAEEGGLKYAQDKAEELTDRALQYLVAAQPEGDAGKTLYELANGLLGRSQ